MCSVLFFVCLNINQTFGTIATKNFDLKVSLKESAIKAGEARDYTFSSIERSEYRGLVAYMESKNLNVIKPQEEKRADVDLGEDDGDDEDEESDGDYQAPASDDDENSGIESGSDSENDNSDNDSESGSDGDKKPAVKKEKKVSASSKKRPRGYEDGGKKKRQKKEKKEKDPNAPKGATTSYMLFSNDVRAAVKGENPGLSVTELSKVIGAKWREMSAEDKEPYEEKARKDKQRFTEETKAYKASKAGAEDVDDNDD
jgi:structure-specific recognition protein 1